MGASPRRLPYVVEMTASALHDRIDPALYVAVDRLRALAPVERIILFGSRARGDHGKDSDWDLCVLLSDGIQPGDHTPISMWQAVRDLGLPIQVVPMRSSVFETRRHDVNALAHDVAEDGIVIFEAPERRAR